MNFHIKITSINMDGFLSTKCALCTYKKYITVQCCVLCHQKAYSVNGAVLCECILPSVFHKGHSVNGAMLCTLPETEFCTRPLQTQTALLCGRCIKSTGTAGVELSGTDLSLKSFNVQLVI